MAANATSLHTCHGCWPHPAQCPCAGVPALCDGLILHVDPQTWTIALSPDRAALVVFLRGKDCSLLSGPVRVDVSLPQERSLTHKHPEHTRIDAMGFAGERHPIPIVVCDI